MKNLIKVEKKDGNVRLVSGRMLHKKLEIKTQFTKWIQRMCEYGFEENIDYTVVDEKVDSQKRLRTYDNKDYILTLNMAKEIAMIQKTPIGKKFREYFIECERLALQELPWDMNRLEGKSTNKEMNTSIDFNLQTNTSFIYSNFSNLVYKEIFGKTAKQLKLEKGLTKSQSLRDRLTIDEIKIIEYVEKQIGLSLDNGMTYYEIKDMIHNYHIKNRRFNLLKLKVQETKLIN